MKRLVDAYSKATGLDWKVEHGEWNVAHKILLGAGIPTIEQVGGDVDIVKGKRMTLAATPWKFEHGDACQVRLVAICDPSGKCRIGQGK
jgi:kynurenine formamidase